MSPKVMHGVHQKKFISVQKKNFTCQYSSSFIFLQSINMDTMIEDHLKNPIKALEVFSLSIQCLKKKCIDFFQKNHVSVANDDIQWILSVPAIWGESAKQFMRMAAEQVGYIPKTARINILLLLLY